MSRSAFNLTSLAAALPSSSSSPLLASSIASSSRVRLFSTSAPSCKATVSKKKKKWAEFKKRLDSIKVGEAATQPNYITGAIEATRLGPTGKRTIVKDLFDGSRIQQTLVHPTRIWGAPIPDFEKGERPANYLPGLTEEDKALLFGALPNVSAALRYPEEGSESARAAEGQRAIDEQVKQSHTLMKILDLRNASRAEIRKWNKERVLQVFADAYQNEQGVTIRNTGGARAQAAMLTQQIRDLHEHLQLRPKDMPSRRALRAMLHKRAAHLKYYKRTAHPEEYAQTLADLGLHPRAVEGELILKGI